MASAPTRHDIEAKIVKRCWQDDSFRREFTSDPAACFVKYLNVPKASVPAVVVHEEAAGTWHIVLPAKPTATGELSDADLENVAGGVTPTIFLIGIAVTAIVSVTVAAAGGSQPTPGGGHPAPKGW